MSTVKINRNYSGTEIYVHHINIIHIMQDIKTIYHQVNNKISKHIFFLLHICYFNKKKISKKVLVYLLFTYCLLI